MGVKDNQNKEALVMKTITEIIGGAQGLLNISWKLEDIFEEYLDNTYKTFLHILRVMEAAVPAMIRGYAGTGRKPYQYKPFIRCAWAKSFFKIDTNTELIQRLKTDSNLRLLCGFDTVPGKSTFSRNFSELAETAIMSETLDKLVIQAHADQTVYHVSRDSTAIEAREKAPKKEKEPEKTEKKRRGRPRKGEKRPPKPETVLEKQVHESAEESLKNIDTACAHGCKKNSHGNTQFWTGYKLHLDVSDTGFPLSAFVSGANVHDSQLAIPLEKITESKVFFCYSLMDAAYDSTVIDNYIRSRGRKSKKFYFLLRRLLKSRSRGGVRG
jgi:transposase